MSRSAPRSWAALCVAAGVCAATVTSACSRAKPEQKAAVSLSAAETDALRAALATYAEIAFGGYSDAVGGAKVLARSVEALLNAALDDLLPATVTNFLPILVERQVRQRHRLGIAD